MRDENSAHSVHVQCEDEFHSDRIQSCMKKQINLQEDAYFYPNYKMGKQEQVYSIEANSAPLQVKTNTPNHCCFSHF